MAIYKYYLASRATSQAGQSKLVSVGDPKAVVVCVGRAVNSSNPARTTPHTPVCSCLLT